jgi:hypothetical protein
MNNKILSFVIILFSLTLTSIGCAKENYAKKHTADTSKSGQTADTCAAYFKSGHCVSLVWETVPSENTTGAFIFKTLRASEDGTYIAEDIEGTVSVVLWMPSMGHGSSPVNVERTDVGTYRATNVFFVMPGSWEIRVQLSAGNKILDTAILPIEI